MAENRKSNIAQLDRDFLKGCLALDEAAICKPLIETDGTYVVVYKAELMNPQTFLADTVFDICMIIANQLKDETNPFEPESLKIDNNSIRYFNNVFTVYGRNGVPIEAIYNRMKVEFTAKL